MSYPPFWRAQGSEAEAITLMRAYPFAHCFTSQSGLRTTRIPFVADVAEGQVLRLRAHLNANNPQCQGLDGAQVLVVFSGASTYVSPHWRVSPTRAGTYDYEEVRIGGRVRIGGDIAFFRQLVDELSALIEPQYADIGDYPVWQTSMAPEGYVERLFPHVLPFVVEVESVESISKLHQNFPEEDRRSIANHLARSRREGAQIIAEKIRKSLPG